MAATKEQLETALRNAHNAGDEVAARALANALRSGSFTDAQDQPSPPQTPSDPNTQRQAQIYGQMQGTNANPRLTDQQRMDIENEMFRYKRAYTFGQEDQTTQAKRQELINKALGVSTGPERTDFPMGQDIVGAGESLLSMGSSALAEPVAGLSGMLVGALPNSGAPEAAQAIQNVRNTMTYQPRTGAGRQQMSQIGGAFEGVASAARLPLSGLAGIGELATGQGLDRASQTVQSMQGEGVGQTLGNRVLEETGSPELAAIAHTIPTATLEAMGIKGMRNVRGDAPAGGLSARPNVALSQAAPSVTRLKDEARSLYRQVDELGARVDDNQYLNLAIDISSRAREMGFDQELTPRSAALLRRVERQLGDELTLTDIDQTRRAAQAAAADFNNPTDAAIGSMVIEQIDNFLDQQGQNIADSGGANAGTLYREARNLWGRARRSEVIDGAIQRAENQASGFENGLRIQFRQILNNPRKRRGFSREELDAMRGIVQGGPLENTFKFLGKFGLTEGQRTNALMSMVGIGAGYGAAGPLGAVVVPGIGQVSMQAAQRMTRGNTKYLDDLVKAGSEGSEVARAYLRNTPASDRTVAELTELLIRPGVSLERLNSGAPSRLVRDALFTADYLKDLGVSSFAALPGVIENLDQQENQEERQ